MVFRNVAVGIWSYDTHTNTNVPWATRRPLLVQAVNVLETFRNMQVADARAAAQSAPQGPAREAAVKTRELWGAADSRFSMIFVAPEYMAMGVCSASLSVVTDDRFLDEDGQQEVVESLTEISEAYGRELIFVPGTVAFKKPFLKLGDTVQTVNARAAKLEQRIEWGAQQIKGSFAKQGYALTDAQARQQRLSAPMSGHNARTTDDKLNLLRGNAGNFYANISVGQNTMYMFHRGKIIASYRKRCDFHEVLPGDVRPTIFIPGHKSGRATVGGVPLGMEICLDHGVGVLSSSPTATPPAVHMLCSAAVPLSATNVVVREGGYVLHASSHLGWSGAWRKVAGAPVDIITHSSPAGNGTLKLGVMELDFP